MLKRPAPTVGRLSPEFPDSGQRLELTGESAERLASFASFSARPLSLPGRTEFHHGDAAVELGYSTQNLTDQSTRRIVGVGGEICAAVRSDHLATQRRELLQDDPGHHEVTGESRSILHEDVTPSRFLYQCS